jgi:hypothetical protein
VTTSGTKPAKEIPSNCRVLSGEVTRVDLWLEGGDDETCSLTGRLTVDGKAADGWVAALDHDREVVLDQVKFLEPGLFRIGVDGAGTYRLRLSNAAGDPSAMLVILDEVTLTEGQRFWSLDLETGSLEGTLRAQADPGALVFCRWQRGDLEVLAPLVPDADGRFRCGRVPAGRGAIVRFDPARPIEEQTPAVLRELMVEAGKALTVEL